MIRKLCSFLTVPAIVAAVALAGACGGANDPSSDDRDDDTEEEEGDEKPGLTPTGPLPLDVIRLTITESNATLFPDGVYFSPWSKNQSSSTPLQITKFGFMPGSPHELAFGDSILVAHSGARIRVDESTTGRETPAGHIKIWGGTPVTGNQGLSNDTEVPLHYTYDAATDAFKGSFEGVFSEDGSDGARTARVKADFHINNYIEE